MELTFNEILIGIFACFIICFLIDKGGDKLINFIKKIYKYKIG